MDSLLLVGIVAAAAAVLALGVVVLVVAVPRKVGDSGLVAPLQSLNQTLAAMQAELRGLSERVATVERAQGQVGQGIASLGTRLAASSTLTQGLVETTSAIHNGLTQAQQSLAALQAHARARQELEQRTAESIRRLEAVIAGTQAKGAAGENIVEVVFAQLPAEWQVRGFQVGNKTVEFGLRLPNNLVLPIDSKWAATSLLEQFLACDDTAEQQRLKAQIERAVLSKAREVRKYIDPSITVNFGVAAVPDAIFDLCSGVQTETLRLNVVLISYSMFVPYLLLVFHTILKTAQNVDLQKLNAYLEDAGNGIKAAQEELEGRFSRAVTMLANARDEMRMQLGKASGSLAGLQLGAGIALPDEAQVAIDAPESSRGQAR